MNIGELFPYDCIDMYVTPLTESIQQLGFFFFFQTEMIHCKSIFIVESIRTYGFKAQ